MFSRIYHMFKFWLVIAVVVLFIVFAAVNREFVDISLFPLPYIVKIPKFLMAIICFGAGLLVGGIVMSLKLARMIRMAKKEHQHVMALQNEVTSLHNERQHAQLQ